MATCNPTIDPFQAADATLDITDKYNELMQASMAEGSVYMKMKDTIFQQFDNLNINTTEKAQLSTNASIQMMNQLSASCLNGAQQWAIAERDGAYTLAKTKAETENALAEYVLIQEQICKAEKETELVCAQVTATSAGSIRDNGTVTEFETDGCRVRTLGDNGLKYEQTKQVQAATYQTFADSFRKSGVVQINTDALDGTLKGLSGDQDGYTWQQQQNAERQRLAYEDSKRNHAANASASMIASMLSAEIAPNEGDVQRWRDAVDFLNKCDPSTETANCTPPV